MSRDPSRDAAGRAWARDRGETTGTPRCRTLIAVRTNA
ncbi:hypothetical protein OH687_30600 [Burkholderia anthina]|nr:hypothetical protein OH687_30600 [Burkholderia anthina]